MKLNLKDLEKLSAGPAPARQFTPGQKLQAIVRVREAGYVPPGVHVRARIDERLFTADFPAEQLEAMRLDRGVASVELNEPLRQID